MSLTIFAGLSKPERAAAAPLPPIALTAALAVALLAWLWPLTTIDMGVYLLPWFDHILQTGPVAVFSEPFSNYTPAYLYLLAAVTPLSQLLPAMTVIKLLSVAGNVALALSVRRLLQRLGAPQADRGAALVLICPSVALNAGMLGQCDAMWAAAIVMALVAALDRRHAVMLAWCGLALGFKLQAVFAAPFFVALLIQRRVPFRLWPIAPLTAFLTVVPAWAAGWPLTDLATIYLRQADHFQALSMNAANIWMILGQFPLGGVSLVGLAIAAAIGATAAYIAYFSARPLDDRSLIAAALLAPLMTVGLLPRMHDRYFFLADVLALALALSYRDEKHWRIVWLVQAGSAGGVIAYLVGLHAIAVLGALCMILATIRVLDELLHPAANDNPILARAA